MSILAWIGVGLIAGSLAGLVMKRGGYGIIGNIIVGEVGAIIGGFLAGVIFEVDYLTAINIRTIVVALVGAVILITFYELWRRGWRFRCALAVIRKYVQRASSYFREVISRGGSDAPR